MNYMEFIRALANDSLPQIFLLAGEEPYFIQRAEKAVLQKLVGSEVTDAERELITYYYEVPNIRTIIEALEATPFFSDKNIVVVKEAVIFRAARKANSASNDNSDEFPAAGAVKDKCAAIDEMENLIDALENLPPATYIIFTLLDVPDKRRKLYKAVDKIGLVLDSPKLRTNQLSGWLEEKLRELGRSMGSKARYHLSSLLEVIDRDKVPLEFLDKQFDKIMLYSDSESITAADIDEVFAGFPEVSVFSLNSILDKKDVRAALELLRRQLKDGVYFTVIVALLTRHVRQLWQAKRLLTQGVSLKSLGSAMNLHPYPAELAGKASSRFTERQLKEAQLLLIDADYKLKSGQAGHEILEEAIIKLCQ